jgi:hypothetical protein
MIAATPWAAISWWNEATRAATPASGRTHWAMRARKGSPSRTQQELGREKAARAAWGGRKVVPATTIGLPQKRYDHAVHSFK